MVAIPPQNRTDRLLWQDVAVARTNLIFVASAGLDTGDKDFPRPHSRRRRIGWRRASSIEVADDADALCIGGPDGEGGPLDAIDLAQVGTESFEKGRKCEPSASSQTSSSPRTVEKR